VTSQCACGQLSVVYSRPDKRKKGKSNTKKRVRTESVSAYVYLKVKKGHNSIYSWCSATKPGVSRPHIQLIPVK